MTEMLRIVPETAVAVVLAAFCAVLLFSEIRAVGRGDD